MRPAPERITSATGSQPVACVRGAASRASRATCLSVLLLCALVIMTIMAGAIAFELW